MTLWRPPQIPYLSDFIFGHWPEGDEDAMRRAAKHWSDMAEALKTLQDPADKAMTETLAAFGGQAHQALEEHWHGISAGNGSDINRLIAICDSYAKQLEHGATDTEHAKLTIYISAMTMVASLAWSLIPGVGEIADAAVVVAVKAAIREAIEKLVGSMATKAATFVAERAALRVGTQVAAKVGTQAVIGAGTGAGTDAAAQGIEIAEGHRHGFDLQSAESAATSGAVAGGVAGPVAGKVGGAVSGRLAHGETPGVVSGFVGHQVGEAAGNTVGNVAGQVAGSPDHTVDWDTALEGGGGGALSRHESHHGVVAESASAHRESPPVAEAATHQESPPAAEADAASAHHESPDAPVDQTHDSHSSGTAGPASPPHPAEVSAASSSGIEQAPADHSDAGTAPASAETHAGTNGSDHDARPASTATAGHESSTLAQPDSHTGNQPVDGAGPVSGRSTSSEVASHPDDVSDRATGSASDHSAASGSSAPDRAPVSDRPVDRSSGQIPERSGVSTADRSAAPSPERSATAATDRPRSPETSHSRVVAGDRSVATGSSRELPVDRARTSRSDESSHPSHTRDRSGHGPEPEPERRRPEAGHDGTEPARESPAAGGESGARRPHAETPRIDERDRPPEVAREREVRPAAEDSDRRTAAADTDRPGVRRTSDPPGPEPQPQRAAAPGGRPADPAASAIGHSGEPPKPAPARMTLDFNQQRWVTEYASSRPLSEEEVIRRLQDGRLKFWKWGIEKPKEVDVIEKPDKLTAAYLTDVLRHRLQVIITRTRRYKSGEMESFTPGCPDHELPSHMSRQMPDGALDDAAVDVDPQRMFVNRPGDGVTPIWRDLRDGDAYLEPKHALFRMDSRGPEMFGTDFAPRNPDNLNIAQHVGQTVRDGFVSLSNSPELTVERSQEFVRAPIHDPERYGLERLPDGNFRQVLYMHELYTPSGIDVDATFHDGTAVNKYENAGHHNEAEILAPGGISGDAVYRVWPRELIVDRNGEPVSAKVGEPIYNPNFAHLDNPHFAETHEPADGEDGAPHHDQSHPETHPPPDHRAPESQPAPDHRASESRQSSVDERAPESQPPPPYSDHRAPVSWPLPPELRAPVSEPPPDHRAPVSQPPQPHSDRRPPEPRVPPVDERAPVSEPPRPDHRAPESQPPPPDRRAPLSEPPPYSDRRAPEPAPRVDERAPVSEPPRPDSRAPEYRPPRPDYRAPETQTPRPDHRAPESQPPRPDRRAPVSDPPQYVDHRAPVSEPRPDHPVPEVRPPWLTRAPESNPRPVRPQYAERPRAPENQPRQQPMPPGPQRRPPNPGPNHPNQHGGIEQPAPPQAPHDGRRAPSPGPAQPTHRGPHDHHAGDPGAYHPYDEHRNSLPPNMIDRAKAARQIREWFRPRRPEGGVELPVRTRRSGQSPAYAVRRYPNAFGGPVSVISVRVHATHDPHISPRDFDRLWQNAQLATDLGFNTDRRLLSGDRVIVDLVPTGDPAAAHMRFHVSDAPGGIHPHTPPIELARHIHQSLGLTPSPHVVGFDDNSVRELSNAIAHANTRSAVQSPGECRNYGRRRLEGVERPEYQAAVEDALRQGNRFLVGADPRTNVYGTLINDGGAAVRGRGNNCLDCSLSALASFQGRPEVSAPRWPDKRNNGTLDNESGEVGGRQRAAEWIGDGLYHLNDGRSMPFQFAGLHEIVREMGPGSSALVINEWQARDRASGQFLYNADGTARRGGSHATVIVYPRDANGPVWWDPQSGVMSEYPPALMTGRSTGLWFTPIPAPGGESA
ncbi:MAG: hypothetical protein J2P18_07250 [Nocardia sp.]|nr:hypothetical protein [Nocardia sp.]